MVESSQGKNAQDKNEVKEESPGDFLHLSTLEGIVNGELVGEASKDPAEGSNHHVRSCEGSGQDDDLLAVLEGEESEGDGEDDLEEDETPFRVHIKNFAENGVDEGSQDETKN